MARLIQASRRALLPISSSSLKSLIPQTQKHPSPQIKSPIPSSFFPTRTYISEMRKSAFESNILRILRNEIQYESEYAPPKQAIKVYKSFTVEERPGDQFVRLRRKYGDKEEIKLEATMFDGSASASGGEDDDDVKLHLSLIVDISKGEGGNVFEFVCSVWPNGLEIQNVFMLKPGGMPNHPFLGPNFKELDGGLQISLQEFLEERGIDDDLAAFLHEYMVNKDKNELIRWMRSVKAFVEE